MPLVACSVNFVGFFPEIVIYAIYLLYSAVWPEPFRSADNLFSLQSCNISWACKFEILLFSSLNLVYGVPSPVLRSLYAQNSPSKARITKGKYAKTLTWAWTTPIARKYPQKPPWPGPPNAPIAPTQSVLTPDTQLHCNSTSWSNPISKGVEISCVVSSGQIHGAGILSSTNDAAIMTGNHQELESLWIVVGKNGGWRERRTRHSYRRSEDFDFINSHHFCTIQDSNKHLNSTSSSTVTLTLPATFSILFSVVAIAIAISCTYHSFPIAIKPRSPYQVALLPPPPEINRRVGEEEAIMVGRGEQYLHYPPSPQVSFPSSSTSSPKKTRPFIHTDMHHTSYLAHDFPSHPSPQFFIHTTIWW